MRVRIPNIETRRYRDIRFHLRSTEGQHFSFSNVFLEVRIPGSENTGDRSCRIHLRCTVPVDRGALALRKLWPEVQHGRASWCRGVLHLPGARTRTAQGPKRIYPSIATPSGIPLRFPLCQQQHAIEGLKCHIYRYTHLRFIVVDYLSNSLKTDAYPSGDLYRRL